LSGYLDNLASISMFYEGKVLADLIPRIYDRAGRIVPGMDQADKRRSIMVNAPFIEQGGRPDALPPGTPGAQSIDLKGHQLSATPVVGKSYATRREETAEALAAIWQAAPALAPTLAPFWLAELAFPGAKKLAAIAKKTLPPQFQEEEGGAPPVAQLQQQLAQAQQMIDLLTKELQAKTQVIETETVKAQADVQVKQLELASQERIASLHAHVDLPQAEMSTQSAQQTAALGAQAGTERALWGSVAKSVQQLDAQAFQKDQQAAQIDAERDAQQAQLAAQQQAAQQHPVQQGSPPAAGGAPSAPGTPQLGPPPEGV